MARKNTDSSANDTAEENPTRGGSFVRNEDGSLTQTEGHGFAEDQSDSVAAPASPASSAPNVQE